MLLWFVTTILFAVAVPAMWAQRTLVSEDGYAALAQKAAADRRLQDAMSSELQTQVREVANRGGFPINETTVQGVTNTYTTGPSFPGQFASANRVVHRWMFDQPSSDSQSRWRIDLAPMLSDSAFQQVLNIQVPSSVDVPLAVNAPDGLHQGQLHNAARWGPWVSIGVSVLAGIFALLTLLSARRRGKALTALGVSALLVGAGGWAAPEIWHHYIDDALNHTTGNVRTIAEVMVAQAQSSLHLWLNLTLVVGGGLVVIGIILTLLGGLRRRDDD